MLKSEFRKDYFLDRYVLITPLRAKRPFDIKEETHIKRAKRCVFCPENIEKDLIVKKFKFSSRRPWDIIVLKNKFPAVTPDNPRAYGYQEVIVDTPQHVTMVSALPLKHLQLLLEVYSERTKALARDKKIDYILIFKNEGSKAGASITHIHSQIFATSLLSPDIEQELRAAREYKEKKGSCPYCDIIEKEMKSPRRIFEDKWVAAFCPYASRFHYEAWIFPKRHLDNITQLNKSEIKSFAKALKMILTKLDEAGISYNYFFHQVVSDKGQHFHLRIEPRDSVWAGVELGSGLVINSVPPEAAAKFYKQ